MPCRVIYSRNYGIHSAGNLLIDRLSKARKIETKLKGMDEKTVFLCVFFSTLVEKNEYISENNGNEGKIS